MIIKLRSERATIQWTANITRTWRKEKKKLVSLRSPLTISRCLTVNNAQLISYAHNHTSPPLQSKCSASLNICRQSVDQSSEVCMPKSRRYHIAPSNSSNRQIYYAANTPLYYFNKINMADLHEKCPVMENLNEMCNIFQLFFWIECREQAHTNKYRQTHNKRLHVISSSNTAQWLSNEIFKRARFATNQIRIFVARSIRRSTNTYLVWTKPSAYIVFASAMSNWDTCENS